MADPIPEPPKPGVPQGVVKEAAKPVAPKAVDKAPLVAHLNKLKEEVLKHVGRNDFNPHLWVNRNIRALEVELATSHPATEELAKRVLAVQAPKLEPVKK